jgi:hypothetical protein
MIVFIIHGLRLIRYSKGFLLAMPKTERRGKGKPYDATCAITREARRMIEDVVDGGVPESMGETANRAWGQIFTIDIAPRPRLEMAHYGAPAEDKLSRSLLSCHLPRQ